jgi:hypothetical protein
VILGDAAVAIWCDVAADVRPEFDDWHTHEHMPERLAIPGFLRGSRWVADDGPGYFTLYEARGEATITAGPYLERLNHPTPWSRKMMPHHRNMVRGLCRVHARFGAGLGQALLTLRLSAVPAGIEARLGRLPARKGLAAACLLRHIGRAPRTAEQDLRGTDAAPDWVVLVSAYNAAALASVAQELSGQSGMIAATYRLAYVLGQ